jgi:hypothetical protein
MSLFFGAVYKIAMSLTKWQLAVPFSITYRSQNFVFVITSAEIPGSQKYVVRKGNKNVAAFINLDNRFSQAAKTEEVYLHQTCVLRNHKKMQRMTISSFSNVVIS